MRGALSSEAVQNLCRGLPHIPFAVGFGRSGRSRTCPRTRWSCFPQGRWGQPRFLGARKSVAPCARVETSGQPNSGVGRRRETLAERRRRGEKRAQSLLFPTARPSSTGEKLVLYKLVRTVVS